MAEIKVQQYKVDAVNRLKDMFEGAQGYFFTEYRGLTVEKITELRQMLRDKGAEYHVVKNNYAKIAFRDMDMNGADNLFVGPVALAVCKEEAGPVAKELIKFCKENVSELTGGYVAGEVYDSGQVEAFSKLPTRLELISMLMSTMNAPVTNVARALTAVPEKLVRTLQAVADSKAE